MSGTVTELTDHSFEERVLRAEGPVLVEFWAEWCGPCKILAPILDEIAAEYTGRLTVAKLNIDQNPATAPQYDVRAIPALLVFKNGIVTATKAGAMSKSQLTEFIDANL
ncbi:thioredoxin TrxA [Streptomyces uncialis]|uniref:thioredoxin TrxA n=1 Tax=Streptomyces uncialis TaxID=1048205 RepID=UPI002E30980F|nr:thioredoxin TrxA [Streptomyces uncialis]